MSACARVGAVGILTMMGVLLGVLTMAAWPSIATFGWKFLVTSEWRPNELPAKDADGNNIFKDGEMVMDPPEFGALPTIYGTAVSSLLALVFAVPLSFGAAVMEDLKEESPAG